MFFEHRNNKYPITINYYESIKVLPEKFGIHLSKMFTDAETAEDTLRSLVFDDEKSLALAWYYVEQNSAGMDEDDFLKSMTGKDLERFREAFWQAVVNFSGPLKKNLLTQIWSEFKKELKSAELQSSTSEESLSDSNPEE